MIVYNVTLQVDTSIESAFLAWLEEIHIPEVMDCGLFLESKIFRVCESVRSHSPNSIAVQYRLKSWDEVDEYLAKHAQALQAKTRSKFGEKVLGFRTFLEEYTSVSKP